MFHLYIIQIVYQQIPLLTKLLIILIIINKSFRYTKPSGFADCLGDELPYGWEVDNHPIIGIYYINHIKGMC